MLQNRAFLATIGAAAFLLSGCSGDGTTGPNPNPSGSEDVSLSVSVPSGGANLSAGGGSPVFDLTFTEGGDELIITRVALVLREVELQRQEEDSCEDSSDGDNDDCEEFEVGPFLLDLPLDGSVETLFTLQDVVPGIYDELEFDIHKPEDGSSEDNTFLNENPDFLDVSIRVEGTFNGAPFVYLTDLNEEQEMDLVPPLVVSETPNSTNVTLSIDVATWFRRSDNSLVDPATANKGGENENLVRDNIRGSIEGFEDEDHDGEED